MQKIDPSLQRQQSISFSYEFAHKLTKFMAISGWNRFSKSQSSRLIS
jgi:hypothetical protein